MAELVCTVTFTKGMYALQSYNYPLDVYYVLNNSGNHFTMNPNNENQPIDFFDIEPLLVICQNSIVYCSNYPEIISYINSDGLFTINLESNTPATDAYFNTLVPEITINYTNTDEPIIT